MKYSVPMAAHRFYLFHRVNSACHGSIKLASFSLEAVSFQDYLFPPCYLLCCLLVHNYRAYDHISKMSLLLEEYLYINLTKYLSIETYLEKVIIYY